MKSHKERSKTGCSGCLGRKIKCNEQRPTCRQCVNAGIKCSWDPSSRLHIQKSRRRRKATAHSTSVLEFNFSNAGSRDGCCTSSSTLTGQFQLPVSENIFPEASNSEGNDGALLHAPNHDIGRPTDPVHNQYCLNNGLEFEIPSLLSSYIHPPALPCANSILLSHRDRLYLEYFPTSSLVKVLGKAYAWSNFRYICQNKASEEAIVMYAVMALSASEMNQSLGLPTAHNEGRLYYRLALQRIEDTVNSLNCETSNMEAVLGAIFLVITYAWRFGSSISNFQKHNQCLLTCLNIFLRFPEGESNASIDLTTCPIFTPFCAQILLWILYVDSSCIGGNLSFELMDYFHMYGGESELHKLFTFSRHSYLFIYGQQYPAEQHQDDLENYCPLELIHQDYLFRYRIWRLAERYYRGKVIQSELETLWTEINIFKKAFHDLFQLQRNAPQSVRQSRAFITLSEGLAGYYCNIVLIHRLFPHHVVPIESHDQALSDLFDICYTIHEWYPADPTLGFAWYLLIAGLETKDQIHRNWAYDRLKDLGSKWNTCKWAGDMLQLMHGSEGNVGLENNDHFLRLIQPIS